MAATSLCVESASTGFDWTGGQWAQTRFQPEQIIVRPVGLADDLGFLCRATFGAGDITTEIVRTEYAATRHSCYLQYGVGTEPTYSDAYVCREVLGEGDKVMRVSCKMNRFQEFEFEPSGEWVSVRAYAAPDSSVGPSERRDSMALSVGKCSVIDQ